MKEIFKVVMNDNGANPYESRDIIIAFSDSYEIAESIANAAKDDSYDYEISIERITICDSNDDIKFLFGVEFDEEEVNVWMSNTYINGHISMSEGIVEEVDWSKYHPESISYKEGYGVTVMVIASSKEEAIEKARDRYAKYKTQNQKGE